MGIFKLVLNELFDPVRLILFTRVPGCTLKHGRHNYSSSTRYAIKFYCILHITLVFNAIDLFHDISIVSVFKGKSYVWKFTSSSRKGGEFECR